MRRLLPVALALLIGGPAAAAWAFQPSDPLATRQWYLAADRSFDLWTVPPALAPVRVAVIDSGIDAGHPEFAGRIAAARSFVGGSAVDTEGHGTFVAGEIAAALDNGQGIAGIAFPAQLVVAKVLKPDSTIDPDDEARAIRWALAQGARVINLSFGGARDPRAPKLDAFSQVEQAAIDRAVKGGAVVVAAVGNGDQAPREPWPYATYPAALSHVIGVGAYARDGAVPSFSNRDAVFNDLSAPGTEMFSTFPLPLTAVQVGCPDQGYSSCAPPEYRDAAGTSFAAAQVSAAAALLLAARPDLRPEQVSALLERSAQDATAATGCLRCPVGRDGLSGWGRLDVAAALGALSDPLPPSDRLEPNDGMGSRSVVLTQRRLRLAATLDFWDDPVDIYGIRLRKGQWLFARIGGLPGSAFSVWRSVERLRAPRRRLLYRAPASGTYFLKLFLRGPGAGPYDLRVER
jgi:subtilisin family serine protease